MCCWVDTIVIWRRPGQSNVWAKHMPTIGADSLDHAMQAFAQKHQCSPDLLITRNKANLADASSSVVLAIDGQKSGEHLRAKIVQRLISAVRQSYSLTLHARYLEVANHAGLACSCRFELAAVSHSNLPTPACATVRAHVRKLQIRADGSLFPPTALPPHPVPSAALTVYDCMPCVVQAEMPRCSAGGHCHEAQSSAVPLQAGHAAPASSGRRGVLPAGCRYARRAAATSRHAPGESHRLLAPGPSPRRWPGCGVRPSTCRGVGSGCSGCILIFQCLRGQSGCFRRMLVAADHPLQLETNELADLVPVVLL